MRAGNTFLQTYNPNLGPSSKALKSGTAQLLEEFLHNEDFVWDNCSCLDDGYKGVCS